MVEETVYRYRIPSREEHVLSQSFAVAAIDDKLISILASKFLKEHPSSFCHLVLDIEEARAMANGILQAIALHEEA
jgi:hypothetical protein